MKGVKTLLVDFDAEKGKDCLTADYIQHNPTVPSGPDVFLSFLPKLKEAGLKADVHRVIAEGDLVAVHSTYDNAEAFGGKQLVAFDVFRVQDGKIAEHWDNLTPLATQANPSGHSQTDGPTEIVDLGLTADNKKVVQQFVDEVLLKGDMVNLTKLVSPTTYIQHNTMVADGLDGLGAALEAFAKAGKPMVYMTLHKIIAEGNFVFTMSEGKLGEEATAFFDLFRLEGGLIVEHWDVMSAIPSAEAFAHENGKF